MSDLEESAVLNEHQKKIVGIGKITHEAIRALCETMDDFSLAPWEHTEPWYQRVMVECVTFLFREQQDVQKLHVYWCSQMTAGGWKYGLVYNEETKEHPNLKDFDQVSFEEGMKYSLMVAVALALSPAMARAASVIVVEEGEIPLTDEREILCDSSGKADV